MQYVYYCVVHNSVVVVYWLYLRMLEPRQWAQLWGGAGHSCYQPAWSQCCCQHGRSTLSTSVPHFHTSGVWLYHKRGEPQPPLCSTWLQRSKNKHYVQEATSSHSKALTTPDGQHATPCKMQLLVTIITNGSCGCNLQEVASSCSWCGLGITELHFLILKSNT